MRKMVRKLARGIQIVIVACLLFLIICNLCLIIQERVLGVEHPTVFGVSVAVVASGSMEPAISMDDLILICAQKEYKEGDVITFESGESLTTHRIVGVEEGGFRTKGDANNAEDLELILPEQILGRVIGEIPYVGRGIGFLKTPLGMMIIVFVGLILIEFPFFFQRQETETDREER